MTATFASFLVVVVMMTVLLFLLIQNTFACKPKLSVRPVAFGHAGDQFIAITNSSEGTLCLFQLPNSSVVEGKYYLSEGKPLEEAWSPLKGKLKSLDIGLIIADPSGGHYLVLSFINSNVHPTSNLGGDEEDKKPLVFNIDKKELVSLDDQKKAISTPGTPVSTKEPMVVYNAVLLKHEAFLTKYSYGGLQPPSSDLVTIDYLLCAQGGGQQQQLVAKESKESEECATPLTPEASDIVGFSDDTHFYFISKEKAFRFEKAAIGSKLGKPVLFREMKTTELLVDGPSPNDPGDHTGGGGSGGGGRKSKGSGSSALVIVVVTVLLLLLCILAGVGLFCVCQQKNAQQESAKGKDSKGKGKGKGKGSKKGSSSMSKGGKKGLKTKTSGRMASSKMSKKKSSTGKVNSKRSSLRGGGKSKKRKSTSLSGRKGSSKKGSTAAASRSGKFSSKTSRKASSRKLSSGKSKSKRRTTV